MQSMIVIKLETIISNMKILSYYVQFRTTTSIAMFGIAYINNKQALLCLEVYRLELSCLYKISVRHIYGRSQHENMHTWLLLA